MKIYINHRTICNKWTDSNGIPIFDIDEINYELKKFSGSKNTRLKKYLKQKYSDKLINVANVYDAYFDKKTAGEYSFPAKRNRISSDEKNAKVQITKNLESVLKNAKYITTGNFKVNDNRIFDVFKTVFGIRDHYGDITYYIANVNIQVVNNCFPRLYDITKIKKK